MKFKPWFEAQWPMTGEEVPWPILPGMGEDPHERDTPPERTSEGDFILYHGTSMPNAQQILKSRKLTHDDLGVVGVTTTTSEAAVFACMKAAQQKRGQRIECVILRLIIDKDWLLEQEPEVHKVWGMRPWKRRISREVGGSGRNQWLVNASEVPLKDVKIFTIDGEKV